MAIDVITLIVGQAPQGMESLQYVSATILGLFTVKFILEMFIHVFNLLNRLNK